MERFGNYSNENTFELVNNQKILTYIEKLPRESLDVILQQFYADIHKKWSGL